MSNFGIIIAFIALGHRRLHSLHHAGCLAGLFYLFYLFYLPVTVCTYVWRGARVKKEERDHGGGTCTGPTGIKWNMQWSDGDKMEHALASAMHIN